MSKLVLSKYINQYIFLLDESLYSPRIELFFKGWYLIVLVKLLWLGPLFQDLMEFQNVTGKIVFPGLPSASLTRLLIILVLLTGIVLKRHYLLSIVIFLATLLAHRLTHEVVNGGDLVILFFMFLGIFCNDSPRAANGSASRTYQIAITNFNIFLGQIQIAIIYLVSGWDKLISPQWRDASALFNLLHVDFYATNWVHRLIDGLSTPVLVSISWLVILFELLFSLLVWFPRTRYYVLGAGVLFHLFIGIGLSLPDFALVMTWCYLLFIRDQDISIITKKFTQLDKQLI